MHDIAQTLSDLHTCSNSNIPLHQKHLLLSFWLFNSSAHAYYDTKNKIEAPQDLILTNHEKQTEQKTVKLLESSMSLGKVATQVKKSICYVRRIAEINGIPHASNSNASPNSIKHQVVTLALLGRHRNDISKQLNISVGYVEQTISNTPGLTAWRKSLKKLRNTHKAIREIKLAKERHPEWRRKELKEHCNKAFFYLYNHSKTSLEEILPPKQKPSPPCLKGKHNDYDS